MALGDNQSFLLAFFMLLNPLAFLLKLHVWQLLLQQDQRKKKLKAMEENSQGITPTG
jgi:hypothetical protein